MQDGLGTAAVLAVRVPLAAVLECFLQLLFVETLRDGQQYCVGVIQLEGTANDGEESAGRPMAMAIWIYILLLAALRTNTILLYIRINYM